MARPSCRCATPPASTRTTIYNILEGKVVNVQQSTLRKISDFFGVSYEEIETIDFEAKEIIESSASPKAT